MADCLLMAPILNVLSVSFEAEFSVQSKEIEESEEIVQEMDQLGGGG